MTKYFALLLAAALVGCGSPGPKSLDPDRILHMAGEEAGQIVGPRERLTRQLNIANRETETGKPANARDTLALARQTLAKADKKDFTDQERLAGWISLSELARAADDKPFANAALDQAMLALNQIMPETSRCEYVPGIEVEVLVLRGNAEAAKLLRTAGEWATDLPPNIRREALVIYTEALFHCDDYEGGRLTLRHDRDAAWRTDALAKMSDKARNDNTRSNFVELNMAPREMSAADQSRPASPTTSPSSTGPFIKSLDFKSNYYRP